MASPDRRLSDPARPDPVRYGIRGESGFIRLGRDAGRVELSANAYPGVGDSTDPEAQAERDEDRQLLANLIRGLVGERAGTISTQLVEAYGSLPRVLKRFEESRPAEYDWPADISALLANLSRTLGRVLQREAFSGPVMSSGDRLIAYLHHDMAQLSREVFRVLYLDSANRLLADRVMWEGSVAGVQIHPREVLREALDCNATALILVHNHPSGDPTPSAEDVAMTHRLMAACEPFDVAVHDHIVIARGGFLSMRGQGLMPDARAHARRHTDFSPSQSQGTAK